MRFERVLHDDALERLLLQVGVRNEPDELLVLRGDDAGRQLLLHLLRERGEGESCGDVGRLLLHLLGDVASGEPQVAERRICLRLLKRRQIDALRVLDELHLPDFAIGELVNDDRDGGELRDLRGARAAMPGDDLVGRLLILDATDEERLQDAAVGDARRELVESSFVVVLARVERGLAELR